MAAPAAVAGTEDVLRTVEQWAQAWSTNDVNRYLAFYAKDFKVPGGEARADWEQARRDRIAKPKKIEVRIGDPQVKTLGPNRMLVAFRQDRRQLRRFRRQLDHPRHRLRFVFQSNPCLLRHVYRAPFFARLAISASNSPITYISPSR